MGRKYNRQLPGPVESIRAVSGHFIGRSIERLFSGRPLRRTLLLRDPERMNISWYNFRMMRYLAAGQATYPFEWHMRSIPTDSIARFLLERWFELPWWRLAALPAAEKRRMLDEALSGFDFTGDISDCDRLVAEVSAALGISGKAVTRNTTEDWHSRVKWTPVRLEDLAPETRRELAARTRLDRYLWQRWGLHRDAEFDASAALPFLASELARPWYEVRRQRARGRRT
jgi:hypothetical protein